MSDRGEAPGPSREDKGKAKVGEPSGLTSGDDQSEKNEPGPDSGNKPEVKADETEQEFYNPPRWVPGCFPRETMRLTIVLTKQEVAEIPKLYLTADEVFLLTDRAETLADPPGRFSADVDVTDKFDNRYRLKISNHSSGSPRQFLVNTDWSRYVYINKLKEGDVLWFFRLLDPVSKQTCYALRLFKNPGNYLAPSVAPGDVAPSLEELHSVLSKTLTLQDIDPTGPVLYIDASEAYTLTDRVELLRFTSIPRPMMLSVFDEDERLYDMLLSYCSTNRFSISQEWGRFVTVHRLEAGDRILFYRYPNDDGSDPFYELKYVRQEKSEQLLNLPDRKRKPGPGYRGIPDPVINFTKTLSAYPPKLFFDASEAWLITGCSQVLENCAIGTLLMNLLVYDEGDRPYDMVLTLLKHDDGEAIYTLDSGWHRFVYSHGLKAGDKVTIYSTRGEPYYSLRYTRVGLPSGSGASGVVPSGSGASGEGPRGSGEGPRGSGDGPSGSGASGVGPSVSSQEEADRG